MLQIENAHNLNSSLDDYVTFVKEGYWGATGRAEVRQPDLIVQIDLSGLDDAPAQKVAARAAMEKWSSLLPITFDDVTSKDHKGRADIVFDNEEGGAAFGQGSHLLNIEKNWYGGDGFGDGNFDMGGYGYHAYIHEIGHALGLGHGGIYNGSGTFADDAQFTHDSWQYSVMSYFPPQEAGHASNQYFLTSPMYADIEALTRKYFQNPDGSFVRVDSNTGDDTYGFDGKAGFEITSNGHLADIGFTIHDTSGYDTLNFSGSTSDTEIDLRPDHFSSVNGNTNNIFVYGGHNADQTEYFIEKAVGGIYADDIIGNAGANELIGNSGNDRIDGGGGDDLLTGGAGDDVFVFNAEFGRDTITDFQDGDLIEFNYDVFADPQAVFDHTSQVGSDVVITADADNSIILESVTLSDLRTNDFYFVA